MQLRNSRSLVRELIVISTVIISVSNHLVRLWPLDVLAGALLVVGGGDGDVDGGDVVRAVVADGQVEHEGELLARRVAHGPVRVPGDVLLEPFLTGKKENGQIT